MMDSRRWKQYDMSLANFTNEIHHMSKSDLIDLAYLILFAS